MSLKEFKADLVRLLFSPDETALAAERASFTGPQRTVRLWHPAPFSEIEAAERAKPDGKSPSLLHAMGLKLPYPRGVYRFKTFEEADAWEMNHRIAAAVKRLRNHQR